MYSDYSKTNHKESVTRVSSIDPPQNKILKKSGRSDVPLCQFYYFFLQTVPERCSFGQISQEMEVILRGIAPKPSVDSIIPTYFPKERSFDTIHFILWSILKTLNSRIPNFFDYRCFLFCIFMGMSMVLSAQSKPLSFKDKSIVEILKGLENTNNSTFNYDPTALSKFTFSGQLPNSNILTQLTQLFYKTPFTFEQSNDNILIYLAPPKTYQICGTLKDKESGTTLPLANIYLDDQKQGIQSDDNGFFQVEITAQKHQVVTISYIGYQSQSLMVQEFNQTDCADFLLAIDPTLFGEAIIVKDYILQEITEGETYNSVRFDYQKLLNKHTIIEQDILKTIQLIPGVTSIDESATNLQIRGGTPDQNLIIWEDVTLYDPGHLFGMISAINPYIVDDIQVFKGVFDPSYDNRLGGIVDISLSDSIRNQFQGGLGSTMTEAHAYLKSPIVKDKLSLILSGRKTINGLYNSPTITNYSNKVFQETKIEEEQEEVMEGDREAEQQLNFYDLNGKLIFKPIDKLTIKASWFRTYNAFNYTSIFLEEDLASTDEVLFETKAFNWSNNLVLHSDWSLKLGYSISNYSNDYQFTLTNQADDFTFYNNLVTNSITDQTLFTAAKYQWSPHLNFSLGYDYNIKSVDYNIDLAATYEEDLQDVNTIEGHFHNTYLGFNFQQKKLSVNGGLRNTFYIETQKNKLSPRLNIQYGLTGHLKLKGSAGIFQQYISQLKEFGENSLDLNNQVWIINRIEEDEIEVIQSAKKVAGGFIFQYKGWLIDIEGYYNQTIGLSTYNPTFNSSAGNELEFSEGNSTAKGIDLLIKKRWRNYHIWANYSLSKVDFLFPEIIETAFPASNDQRHKFSLVNTWQYKKWNFSVNYQFKTGLPFTEALGIETTTEYDDDTQEVETYSSVAYDEPNATKLGNYSRLDIGISYRPTFKHTNLQSEISLSLLNLLNTNNQFSRDYFIDDFEEEEETFIEILTVNRRLLKRTPLVSVRVYW